MIGIINLIASLLTVTQVVIKYLGQRALIKAGRLERDNVSLKETLRRNRVASEANKRCVPANDRDVISKL